MADVTISSMIGDIEKYKFNPVMIQRVALEALRIASDNTLNIVDPTNPFVFCLENTATNVAAFMQQNEASTRRLYPSSALTDEDLYLHMSDKDYIGRFATPSSAFFTVLLSKTELLSRLILDTLTGIKKITIPRNTYFTIAGIDFSLQYPVDIKLMPHGGLQITYNNTIESPLLPLTTNVVSWDEVSDSSNEYYIRFTVEAHQFNVITTYNDITTASGFKTDITMDDQFYHVRCYLQNSSGVYVEIPTTHTQQIYDPSVVTAVITVLTKSIRVVIPIIYISSGLASGKLRIDLYQTKGNLRMLLGNYPLEDFNVNWYNINKTDNDIYSTAISNFKTIAIYSITNVDGGRSSISFNNLRSKVIKNAIGVHNLPVTNIQLVSTLEDAGYDVVRNTDTITNRIFLATKDLPKPLDDRIITAASSSMATANFTLGYVGKKNCVGVIDNGDSLTLTPDTIYRNINGIVKPITQTDFDTLNNLPLYEKCLVITNGGYLYSPFHYVLDATGKTFEVRPYYLDNPFVEAKKFIYENTTVNMQVSLDSTYVIYKTANGYTLSISTKSSQNYKDIPDKDVQVQLGLNYRNEIDKAYLLGNLIGTDATTGERKFEFYLDSNFDIDSYDYLNMGSFKYANTSIVVKTQLLQEFDVYFTASNIPFYSSKINDELGFFQLNKGAYGITHEKLKIRFGYPLKNLWVKARSNVDTMQYQTYSTSVEAVYKEDILAKDPITGSVFEVDKNGNVLKNPDGSPKYNIAHHKGDPVLNLDGTKVYETKANEIKYDKDGIPLLINDYRQVLTRSVDILTIDGVYYFAKLNNPVSYITEYTNSIVDSLLKWITVDLIEFNSTLLDQTKVYFYPKVTLGDIKAITLNSLEVTIPASSPLKVELHVSPITYNDPVLLNALSKTTIKTIDAALKNNVVSTSAIEYALIDAYGSDVINVDLYGIGGPANYKAFTIINKSSNCSIRKRLVLLPDNEMIVEEDVTITFIKHGIEV